MSEWAADCAGAVAAVVRESTPTLIVTSLFGVEVLALATGASPVSGIC